MTALEALVTACEEAFAGGEMAAFDASDDVSEPPTGITFGMIRDARSELEQLKA